MTKTDLEALLQQLVALGEDAEELEYWRTIFDALTPEHQTELEQNLQSEIQALKATQEPVAPAPSVLPPPPALSDPTLPVARNPFTI